MQISKVHFKNVIVLVHCGALYWINDSTKVFHNIKKYMVTHRDHYEYTIIYNLKQIISFFVERNSAEYRTFNIS